MAKKHSVLIKNHEERVELKDITTVPEEPGIYALYNNDSLYYVGISETNIRKRLITHNSNKSRKKGNWNNFSWYLLPFAKRIKYIHDIEALIINIATTKRSGKINSSYYNKKKEKFIYEK